MCVYMLTCRYMHYISIKSHSNGNFLMFTKKGCDLISFIYEENLEAMYRQSGREKELNFFKENR